ncbi:amidase domain-containing protein [Streptomyces coryli]|nr:amidase domain-containing protein [Streptomyces coryli]
MAPAQAAKPQATALAGDAQTYFAGENALRVGTTGAAAKTTEAARELAVTEAFAKVREDRLTARKQQKQIADRAGTEFTSAETNVVPAGAVRADGDTAKLRVEERTSFTYAQGQADPYAYRARHDLTFTRDGGQWRLAAVHTPDASGLSVPKKLSPAQLDRAEQTADTMRTALAKNAAKRAAANKTRMAGGGQTTKAAKAAGYDYRAMVDWALRYALEDRDKLPYTPDENDCTTFVSWALRTGGWEEVSGYYTNDDAWWWKDWCDGEWYCKPQHSYTFGGAPNFQRFAVNESERVTNLGNVWDVLLADVVQYDVPNYGEEHEPGHTMMVTDFSGTMPLLSYHSSPDGERKNKPLIDILTGNEGQDFWAYRT